MVPRRSDWQGFLLSVALGLLAALVIGVLLLIGKSKLLIVALGPALFLAAGWLSGNPRLLCLWGLMLTMPLHLSKLFTEFSDRGGGENALRLEISDVFIAALAGWLLWDLIKRRRRTLHLPLDVMLPWMLITLWGVGVIVLGTWRRLAAYEIIRMAKAMVLFAVLVNELTTRGRILQAALALTASVTLQSAIGVLQLVKGSPLGLEKLGETSARTTEVLAVMSIEGGSVWRVGALLLHPNIFGVFLAAVLPLAVGLFLYGTGGRHRAAALAAAALGSVALVGTYSRSAWVSAAAAFTILGFVLILHRRLRGSAFVMGGLAGLLLAVVLGVFSGRIITRLFNSQESAETGRKEWRIEAGRLIREKPLLGWGLNTYASVVPEYSRWSRRAFEGWTPPVHNVYLLWCAETGIVGLALYLFVWARLVWIGVKNLRIRDPGLYVISAACMCGLLAFTVDGLFSFSLRINPIMRVFWVLGAMIVAIHHCAATSDPTEAAPVPAGADD
ncbi:MAG: O-antigen ligase family protein [Planctomycetes bacterium]|nr:O-antigen ligase family protein [Planctomycetota bacterium]